MSMQRRGRTAQSETPEASIRALPGQGYFEAATATCSHNTKSNSAHLQSFRKRWKLSLEYLSPVRAPRSRRTVFKQRPVRAVLSFYSNLTQSFWPSFDESMVRATSEGLSDTKRQKSRVSDWTLISLLDKMLRWSHGEKAYLLILVQTAPLTQTACIN